MTNPLTDPYLVLSKVYSKGAYLKQALADTPVEPLNKARTVKICYGVLEKDITLEYYIRKNAEKTPRGAVKIILKIALYMLEFMGKHDYVVADCAVELTKKLGKNGAAGFVNAFLRNFKTPTLPETTDEKLSVKCSCPLWLVKKIRRSYKSEAENILTAPSAGVCVRFERGEENYLSGRRQTPFKGVYFYDNFVRDDGFLRGDYTFQSIGSAAICDIVEPCEKLLDACAAPGGKSVLLSKKCKSVTACEIYPHRAELIKSYARRMGAEIEVCVADSTVFNKEFNALFDAVLCDCPCSGTGVINENPDIKLFRKEEDIAALAQTQIKILNNCAKYVKAGGRLYYSTCSILPEENDSTVYNFLRQNPEFTLEIPSSPLTGRRTPYGLQFLPHISSGAGFFVTCFIKKL